MPHTFRPGMCPPLRVVSIGVCRAAALLLLLAASHGIAAGQPLRDLVGRPFDARVVTIVDGDTLEVVRDGERLHIRLRLEGIDTPERGEEYSQQATRFSRALLFERRVRVTGSEVDAFGRLVARVSLASQDASIVLLEAGLACHFTRYSRDLRLAAAQTTARAAGRGFWAAGATKPRCARAGAAAGSAAPSSVGRGATVEPRRTTTSTLHGNTSSHVYHASWCPNFNCRNCTAVFSDAQKAAAAGFRPAQDCLKPK